jgi:hypothetical protein
MYTSPKLCCKGPQSGDQVIPWKTCGNQCRSMVPNQNTSTHNWFGNTIYQSIIPLSRKPNINHWTIRRF